ncbi:TPM domain-containing protein [Synechococcus sp. PCC 7336]|uniref:TPM domain-containing protein n=1 Tax=Synechococcus sp. PCC 7336 TaxID=195250 RepID=UPI00138B0966|nr:TPM domain-containing protein [Synechococcus sp. PCC 7336]
MTFIELAREKWMHDRASLIPAEFSELAPIITEIEANYGVRIYCITVPNFDGVSYRDYIAGVANTLFGELDEGEIVLVMSANGRWSVLVGENSPLTQYEVHQVIQAEAAAFFQKGYHYQGMQEAFPALEQKLAGSWEPPGTVQPTALTLITWGLLLAAIFLGLGVCVNQWFKGSHPHSLPQKSH